MRGFKAALLFVVASLGVGLAHSAVPIATRAEQGEPWVPRPEVAKLSAMGFHSVMSDVYWLRAVQIVGGSMRPEAEGTILGRFIDVATTLDPWVGHPYRFAAVWLTGSEADVRLANELLERSLDYHPDEWRNRFYLGFNHFYYLEDQEAAAPWISEASRLPGAPPYLTGLAARLSAGQAGLEVAAGMIQRMLDESNDPWRIAKFEQMLDEIETERRARILDEARAEFVRRNGRDIQSVDELASGGPDRAVLRRLPPEPHGWEWVLSDENEIVSSYTKRRYRPNLNHAQRAQISGWRVGEEDAEEEER